MKIDLKKAYDRLEWSFIEDTLRDASIPDKLTNVIMKMICHSSRRLLWNDKTTDMVKLTKGLGQCNPLSSYLFVLCMERLSGWILSEVEEGVWRPLQTSRGGVK